MLLNQLLAQRYNTLAAALLGLDEQDGLGSVAPELQPVIVLEGERPEYSFLKGELLMARNFSLAASAVLPGAIRIRNPLGSGIIAVVEHITLSSDIISELNVQAEAYLTDLATLFTAQARDLRAGTTRSAMCILSSANTAGVGTGMLRARALANSAVQWDVNFILAPGTGLELVQPTNNGLLAGCIVWRERNARPRELVGV